ncbi:MAG: beta-ketoacyl-[acyl-carrier-protein] synthase family protein [Desulfobacterales bacterium]|nr:beta-ketoacyl-[acyl-carrier-protein] synthase family protein [Desulfobacterales bacterium]
MRKRVAITSIGVCSSLGFSLDRIIDNLKREHVNFDRLSFDDSIVVSPIRDFSIRDFTGPFKDRRYLNRGAQFCLASAAEAIRESGIDKEQLGRAGLFMGAGPNLDIGGEFPDILEGKMDREGLMALWILKFLPNSAASAIAKFGGVHGENLSVTTACAASLQAIGEAYRKIRDGYLDLAFAGGGDSRLKHGAILAYKKAHALFEGNGDPEKASRPFDNSRDGFVPGEGGAFFLLEELGHAKRRGTTIYGEICGFGSSMDGYNMTAPKPDGQWAEKAVLAALCEADMAPGDIDVISAHGTGTPLNDIMEAGLIERIYGEHTPSVIALKSWVGHTAAACGAVELSICLACIKYNYIPRIRNLMTPCHPKINFVKQGIEHTVYNVLLENFGFGGQNSALIVRARDE